MERNDHIASGGTTGPGRLRPGHVGRREDLGRPRGCRARASASHNAPRSPDPACGESRIGNGRRSDLGGAVMDTVREAKLSELRMVCAGLRQWSATIDGLDADFNTAAVELVISAYDGSLADPAWPWVREADK